MVVAGRRGRHLEVGLAGGGRDWCGDGAEAWTAQNGAHCGAPSSLKVPTWTQHCGSRSSSMVEMSMNGLTVTGFTRSASRRASGPPARQFAGGQGRQRADAEVVLGADVLPQLAACWLASGLLAEQVEHRALHHSRSCAWAGVVGHPVGEGVRVEFEPALQQRRARRAVSERQTPASSRAGSRPTSSAGASRAAR